MSDKEKIFFEVLYKKYNKMFLDKSELAQELGVSERTVIRILLEDCGVGLPETEKIGRKTVFPLATVVSYMSSHLGKGLKMGSRRKSRHMN